MVNVLYSLIIVTHCFIDIFPGPNIHDPNNMRKKKLVIELREIRYEKHKQKHKYNKEKKKEIEIEKAYATRECHLGKDEQQHGRLVPAGRKQNISYINDP